MEEIGMDRMRDPVETTSAVGRAGGGGIGKPAGLALMAGVVLTFVGSIFMPGNLLIDRADPTDYRETMQVLGDSAVLAQWMTFITLISLVAMSLGILGLYPLAKRQGGLSGRLLQCGIIVSILEWSVLIIASGMRHFSIHLLQRAELGDYGSLTVADFAEGALAVHTSAAAVTLTFMALFPLATLLLGLGLTARFGSMDVYKTASVLMVLGGLLGVVNFIVALNAPDVGLDLLLYVNNSALYILGICLFIIGLGMYQGKRELSLEAV